MALRTHISHARGLRRGILRFEMELPEARTPMAKRDMAALASILCAAWCGTGLPSAGTYWGRKGCGKRLRCTVFSVCFSEESIDAGPGAAVLVNQLAVQI